MWARVRRPLSRQWLQRHPSESVFGLRRGYSSVDPALSHDISAEMARLPGEASMTVVP